MPDDGRYRIYVSHAQWGALMHDPDFCEAPVVRPVEEADLLGYWFGTPIMLKVDERAAV